MNNETDNETEPLVLPPIPETWEPDRVHVCETEELLKGVYSRIVAQPGYHLIKGVVKMAPRDEIVYVEEAKAEDLILDVTLPGKLLSTVLKVLYVNTKEPTIRFSGSGIESIVADPAHVCMISLSIASEYIDIKANDVQLGLPESIPKLTDDDIRITIRNTDKNIDILSMESVPHGDKTVVIVHPKVTTRVTGINFHFNKENVDVGFSTDVYPYVPRPPTLKHTASAMIDKQQLRNFLERAKNINTSFRITLKDGLLTYLAEDDGYVVRSQEHVVANGNASSSYSIEYVLNLLKSIPSDDSKMQLDFGDDYPMSLKFILMVGRIPVPVIFMLAPRIER